MSCCSSTLCPNLMNLLWDFTANLGRWLVAWKTDSPGRNAPQDSGACLWATSAFPFSPPKAQCSFAQGRPVLGYQKALYAGGGIEGIHEGILTLGTYFARLQRQLKLPGKPHLRVHLGPIVFTPPASEALLRQHAVSRARLPARPGSGRSRPSDAHYRPYAGRASPVLPHGKHLVS